MAHTTSAQPAIKNALTLLGEALEILDRHACTSSATAHLDLAMCRLEELLELSVTSSRARLEFCIDDAIAAEGKDAPVLDHHT